MSKRFLLLAVCLIVMQCVFAQDNYEIQVYSSQTQAKNSTIFELHSNYTFDGSKTTNNGVIPTNHSLHETVEITTGITNNFELGFYLFTNYTPSYGYQFVGTHIRPRIMAPAKWNLPVGLSLSAEIGYQKATYSEDTWSLEIRPIIDKQWHKFYLAFNPTLGVSLKGINNNKTPVFEPNIKASYQFFSKASLGIEYFGSTGYINAFETLPNQQHMIFLAYDLMGNNKWELNLGPGWGLTPATDGFIFKVLVGRRVNWCKRNSR